MTLTTEVSSQIFTGNASATNFPWSNMKMLDADHIKVYTVVIATGAATLLSSSDYTLNGVGTVSGSIDYPLVGSPLATTHQLLVERIVPYTQEMDISNQGAFLPKVIEAQLDLMVMQIQQIKQGLADAVGDGIVATITGAVAGPTSSVDERFARFNGTGGNVLEDSGYTAASFALASHTHDTENIVSPTAITANQNDYSPTNLASATILRISSDAVNRQITGLATGAADRFIVITNVGSFDITLRHENASSSAANRFSFSDNKAIILTPKKSVELYYDSTSSLWRSRTAINSVARVILPASVTNNNGVANTIADITALSFGVISGIRYKFKFVIPYTAAATTTGSRWSVNGPSITDLHYKSESTLTATSRQHDNNAASYDLPAASSASSLTTGNIAMVEGTLTPSADGTLIGRFASEVAASAIIALQNVSYVEYEAISA